MSYVNRWWKHLRLTLRTNIILSKDVKIVSITTDDGEELLFGNIYNGQDTWEAMTVLHNAETNLLGRIHFLAGDFNLHHPYWKQQRAEAPSVNLQWQHRHQADELVHLCTVQLGLDLLNNPHEPDTWETNAPGHRPGVLDLVWITLQDDLSVKLKINIDRRFKRLTLAYLGNVDASTIVDVIILFRFYFIFPLANTRRASVSLSYLRLPSV